MIDNPEDITATDTRILCIDDNPDIADTEAILLRLVGFDACSCYSGRDALTMAEKDWPSICLIDLTMPGMTGDDLAAKLRERAKERPLLLIAVTAMSTDVRDDWTASFDLHLVKPVQPERLLAAVTSIKPPTTPQVDFTAVVETPA